jgi:hypothetical protein
MNKGKKEWEEYAKQRKEEEMKRFGSGSGDRNFLGYRSGINYYKYGSGLLFE